MLSLSHIVEDKQIHSSWPTETIRGSQESVPLWTSAPVGDETESESVPEPVGFDRRDRQSDEMLARYLGDVRQFALLSPAEEQAL